MSFEAQPLHLDDRNWTETAPQYTREYGAAKRVATVNGQKWTRTYDHATFTVDCATLTATVTP